MESTIDVNYLFNQIDAPINIRIDLKNLKKKKKKITMTTIMNTIRMDQKNSYMKKISKLWIYCIRK